jgi:PBP1b-binding outer membrane lipoprotein LpoB
MKNLLIVAILTVVIFWGCSKFLAWSDKEEKEQAERFRQNAIARTNVIWTKDAMIRTMPDGTRVTNYTK